MNIGRKAATVVLGRTSRVDMIFRGLSPRVSKSEIFVLYGGQTIRMFFSCKPQSLIVPLDCASLGNRWHVLGDYSKWVT